MIKSSVKRSILLVCSTLLMGTAYSQQSNTFYNMTSVDQSNRLNPSRMPDNKLNIGLPAISNLYLNFSNSGFTASDVFREDGDSVVVDLDNMLGAMKKKNHLGFAVEVDLLSIGKRIGKRNYLSVHSSLRTNVNITYDKDPFELLINGNGPYLGQTKDIEVTINSSVFIEYGVGFSRSFLNEKLNLGARAKLLSGIANASSEKTDVTFYTDPSTYDITITSDIALNASGDSEFGDKSFRDILLSKNRGFAIDLGASYKWSEKLEFSASILDIGYIHWKDSVKNYRSINPGASYTFSGIDLNDYFNDTSSAEEAFEQLEDSLKKTFDLEETNVSYRNALPTQVYLGANYHLNKSANLGFLLYAQIYKGNVLPGATVSINKKVGRILGAYGSVTYYNRSLANVGIGASVNMGPVQLYAVTDNVIALINYTDSKNIVVRTGLNLRFGHVNGLSRKERKASKHAKEDGNASF